MTPLQVPVLRQVTPGHTRVLVSGDTRGAAMGARCLVRAPPQTDTHTMITGDYSIQWGLVM